MESTIPQALDQLASVLAGGILTVVTACLLGRSALGNLGRLREELTVAEGWILSFACGSALLSALVFVLCALGWFYDATVLVVSASGVACWVRWGRTVWRSPRPELILVPRAWHLIVLVPATIYGALYLVHTLAPETRTDAMGYHLGLVRRYYRSHGFVPLTTNIYAQISQGAEMLYLYAYSIGRESAAKIVHFSFLVATSGAILCLGRRLSTGIAGVFAAVVFFTCPVVIPDATSAYNDCALAFALVSVFYILLLWWEHRDDQWLAVLGIVIGFAFAVKYTGVVAVAAAAVAACSILLRTKSPVSALRGLGLSGLAAAAIGMPWLLKSAVIIGNPLAPFFNRWFPNPYFSVEWESAYTFAMRSYSEGPFDRWQQLLAAPFDLALGERYAGSLGWIILLFPIALLALRKPYGKWLLAAAMVSALPWLSNAGARFLIPSLPFALLATGLALEVLPRKPRLATVTALLVAQCVTSWPSLRDTWYYPNLWSVKGFPWRAALRLEPDKWHLARNVKFFLLADRLDKIDTAETRVLSFGNLPEAYFDAELLVAYQGLENQDLSDAILASVRPRNRPDSALRVTWTPQKIAGIRVAQTQGGHQRPWIVSEIRLLRGGVTVPFNQGAIADAEPLRWHAPRLVDGNVFTNWNSREPTRPGMALAIRLGESVLADGVEVVHPTASTPMHDRLRFSALSQDGRWTAIQPKSLEFVRSPVGQDVARRGAAALLRAHGIDFVVLNLDPRDPYYPQTRVVAGSPTSWGLRRVFVDRSAALYEVIQGES